MPILDVLRHRLVTAEITYHMPDYPGLLQEYIWQEPDVVPDFPQLRKFLEFWERNLDGRLHGVRVAHATLVHPAEFRFADLQLAHQPGLLAIH